MDIGTFDIILLFILAIVVSMIIGLNVIYIIDKKLGNIQINVPKTNSPNVVVKINKESNGIIRNVNVNNVGMSNVGPNKEIIEGFGSIGNTTNTNTNNTDSNEYTVNEGQQIIVDRTNNPNLITKNMINKKKVTVNQGYYSTGDMDSKTKIRTRMEKPDHDDILNYESYGCYKLVGNGSEEEELKKKSLSSLGIMNTQNDLIQGVNYFDEYTFGKYDSNGNFDDLFGKNYSGDPIPMTMF